MSYQPISFVRGGYVSDMNRLGFKEGGVVSEEEPSEILAKNPDVPFVKRINNPQDYPYPEENEDGSISTHLLSAETDEDGNAWVFPTKVYKDNEYKTYTEEERFQALDDAKSSGNALQFNNITEADVFSQNYKTDKFKDYYNRNWFGRALEGYGDSLKKSTTNQLVGLGLSMYENIPYLYETMQWLNNVEEDSAVPKEKFSEKAIEFIKHNEEEIQKLTPKNLTEWQKAFRNASISAPTTAGAMIASVFNPAAGIAFFVAPSAGGGYGEARAEGKSKEQALLFGGTEGAIEGVTERMGLGPLMKTFKASGMKNFFEYLVKEQASEQFATTFSSVNKYFHEMDKYLTDDKISLADKAYYQWDLQVSTAMSTLFLNAGSLGTKGAIDVSRLAIEKTKSDESKLADVMQETLDSKTVDQTTLQQEDIQLEIDDIFDRATVDIKKLENKKSIIEKRLEETPLKKVHKSSLHSYWDEDSNSMELKDILKRDIYKYNHPSGEKTYKGINPEVEEMLHEALDANLSVVAKTTSLTIDAKEQGTDKVRRIQVDTMDELNELIKLMKENSKTLNASRPKDPSITQKIETKELTQQQRIQNRLKQTDADWKVELQSEIDNKFPKKPNGHYYTPDGIYMPTAEYLQYKKQMDSKIAAYKKTRNKARSKFFDKYSDQLQFSKGGLVRQMTTLSLSA